MKTDLKGKVIVITGASSGIGRAAALEFSSRGCNVVLAGRRRRHLEEAQQACIDKGAPGARNYVLDVTDAAAVLALADYTLREFGRIDVWVNNAGVMALGMFHETPTNVHKRVIETDLFGTLHGAKAVWPIFMRQGAGTLINVSSVAGKAPAAYAAAYSAANHAIVGLSGALREELLLLGLRNVHVATVAPATIDTPLFQHAANYSGRPVRTMPPVYSAERAAKVIVRCAERPRREVFVGMPGRLLEWATFFARPLAEWQSARFADRRQLHKHNGEPVRDGNLYEPADDAFAIEGGWKTLTGRNRRDATDAAWKRNPGLAIVAGLTAAWRRRRIELSEPS